MESPEKLAVLRTLMLAMQRITTLHDRFKECDSVLAHEGLSAHLAYRKYLSQFAQKSSDLIEHDKCYHEQRKYAATMVGMFQGYPGECRNLVSEPPYLTQLRLKLAHDAGFETVEAWRTACSPPFWQLEPDPLLRARSAYLAPQGQVAFDHYMEAFQEEALAIREMEAQRFERDGPGSFLPPTRLASFLAIAAEFLGPLGFKPVRTRLTSYAAVDLDVSDDLVLRWSIGEEDTSFLDNVRASFHPVLHLRHRSFSKKIRDSDGSSVYMVIPIQWVVEGVINSYAICYSLQELKLCFYARCMMLTWALPHILDVCRSIELPKAAWSFPRHRT